MKTVYIQGAFPVRSDSDLWPFFVDDARGIYGLYRGEFWDRLVKEEPAYKPRVIQTLVKGLESDIVSERYNAIRAMEHVWSAEGMIALRSEFQKDPHRFVGVASPDSDCPTLFTAWCQAVPWNTSEAPEEGPLVAALAEPFLFAPDFHENFLSVLGEYQPAIVKKHLVEALERCSEDVGIRYLAQLGRTQYAEAAASLKSNPALRDRFIALLWRVAHWDIHENELPFWQSIVVAAGLPPDFRPPGHSGRTPYQPPTPEQQALMERFAQQYSADQEAEKAGIRDNQMLSRMESVKPPLPYRVVIAPEAFVMASLRMESPATALFNRLTELRGKVAMAFSDWSRSQIVAGLEQGGLPKAKAESHADFIVSLGEKLSTTSGADPLAALARAAGTDVAYVTHDSGSVVDGVRMAPIHELVTLLG
jgi:hypothetical protein